MAISIRLTDQVLRLDAKTTQPIWRALDVGAFDQLDISLFVPAIEGGSPSFALNLIGGMEDETTEGWVTVATFDAVTAGGTLQKRTIFGPPRFLRWSVDGQSGTVAFDLHGMAREKRMWSWPDRLPGLVLWLDAASIGGIVDGGSIQTWSDKSPAANHAKQSTGASQPVYRAAGPNGYGSVEFDGTDDWLATDTGDALGDFHVFVVFKDRGTATSFERVLDKNYATGFFLGRDGTTADRWGGGVLEAGAPFGVFGTFTDGRVNVLESVRSGTTHRLFRAGVELASNTVSSSATSTDVYGIGANYTGSQNANVTVYEVLVFNRALADSERDRVTQYLCAKWGVAVG